MKILVIGGSYFVGKRFVQLASKLHDINIFNRGSRPIEFDNVKSFVGDRHCQKDIDALAEKCSFDAVVDFCAYSKGDIENIMRAFNGKIKQYIFISTCDVYERGLNRFLDESAPFESRSFGGEAGDYILGKVSLEQELAQASLMYNISYTSIRPAFIYGPENYAPREGIYFNWIAAAGQIIHPSDATGEFQMVFVDDVVKAILMSVGNIQAYNQAFNLTPQPMETYESFSEALKTAVDKNFQRVDIPLEIVYEKNIPLPFPLTRDESNWYNGEKILSLIGEYTRLTEGLKMTWESEKIDC